MKKNGGERYKAEDGRPRVGAALPLRRGTHLRAASTRSAVMPLAANERVVAEVVLGNDTAVLTDHRVIVVGALFEQSLPLTHIAAIRVRFERVARKFAYGAMAIVAALILFAVASPVHKLLHEASVALEGVASRERVSGESAGLTQGVQRVTKGLGTAALLIPVAAFLALVGGIFQIVQGVIGETVVTVVAGGGEFTFARRGNDRLLHEFVTEVGRNLVDPGRADTAAAPTVPLQRAWRL